MKYFLKMLLFLALAVSVSKADDVTYAVNLAFGSSGTAIGTITTDGTQGVLNPSNIVSWNLTLTDYGTNSTTLITSNSTVAYGVYNGSGANDDLTATPTSLLFNYGVGDAGSWSFGGAAGQGEFCITSWTNCFAYADTYGTWGINGDSQYAFSAASGIQTIGTEVPEVPEPSTLGLLGIGLVSIAGIVRKKVRYV